MSLFCELDHYMISLYTLFGDVDFKNEIKYHLINERIVLNLVVSHCQ